MISVLMRFRRHNKFSLKTAVFLTSPSLTAVFTYLKHCFQKIRISACERTHRDPLCQKRKSRYQNASLTVEASVAFPVFFFAVMYLLQMFCVLRAEVMIAEAGITSARDAAAYSYAAERLANGEAAVAETVLEIFDQKLVRDAAMTGVFYAKCDKEILEQAGVAQGLGGIWVNTEAEGEKNRAEIYYRVKPPNGLLKEKARYYVLRLVYRDWTGEGGQDIPEHGTDEKEKAYMTEHGAVYHLKRTCSYIKIDVSAVLPQRIGEERNASGAKYYACEFCSPNLKKCTQVYITEYGTRYHGVSSCSAITRNVKECSLEEVKKTYPACSRCGKKTEGGDS